MNKKTTNRILIIGNYKKNHGGISSQIDSLFTHLTDDNIYCSIFTLKRNYVAKLFIIIPLLKKAKTYNTLHIHGCSYLGFYPIMIGIIAGLILKKNTVVTFHGGGAQKFLKKLGFIAIPILKKANTITVMSSFLSEIFKKYNLKTKIIPNILDVQGLATVNRKNDFKNIKIISTRSLEPIYNINIIINSFAEILEIYPDSQLTIVGDGSQKENLKKIVNQNNINNILFTGRLSRIELHKKLTVSNFFVSISSFDNQPFSILEAFNAMIPVIAGNVGGIPDIITNDKNGFLLEKITSSHLSNKIIELYRNSSSLNEIIFNAKESLNGYKWQHIRKSVLSTYEIKL